LNEESMELLGWNRTPGIDLTRIAVCH